MAQRYYQKSTSVGTAVGRNAGRTGALVEITAPYANTTNGNLLAPLTFTPMHTAPPVTFYSPSVASVKCHNVTRTTEAGAGAASNIGTNLLIVTCPVGGGSYAVGDQVLIHYTLDSQL
jgi:hypothetical protein